MYLPAIKAEPEAAEPLAHMTIQEGNECILLVDDQKDVVDIEQQMLETLGYQVVARTSSLEALEAFQAQPDKFDLVITDMTMPNMTGDKFAVEVMKIRPDIPVLLCTGFSEMISSEKAKSLGIKGFLMKPVVISDLSSAIRKALDTENEK